MPISVVIADDHALFREMLAQTIRQRAQGIEVVGEAADGDEAIDMIESRRPDVLLLDLRLPKRSTVDVLRDARARAPQTRIVILTGFVSESDVAMTARGGARGYVLKRGPLDPLLEAVRHVAAGEVWADPMLPLTLHREFLRLASEGGDSPHDLHNVLSKREIDVVRLVAEGLSNREIADQLQISEKTVTTHLNHIFDKLNVKSRVQAAILYNNQIKGAAR